MEDEVNVDYANGATTSSSGNMKKRRASRRLEINDNKSKPCPPTTVMFVPWTSGGKLVGMLKANEDRLSKITGFRIKFTEEGGTPIWRQFSTNLGGGGECGRVDCHTCKQGEEIKINCFSRSIVYESSCDTCHPGGNKDLRGSQMVSSGVGLYIGETSRSLFERVGEHLKDAEGLREDSHMVKHWFVHHPEAKQIPKFKFRILGKYKDAMTRQIKEAVRAQNRPGNLNSKGEFGGGTIPRLVVEKSEYDKKKDEILKYRENEQEEKRWEEFLRSKQVSGQNEDQGAKRKRVLPSWMTGIQDSEESQPKRPRPSQPNSPIEEKQAEAEPLSVATNQGRGVAIRGGRKGRGSPCMTVLSLQEHFKNISKSVSLKNYQHNVSSSPKRKLNLQNKTHFSSPSKKIKTKLSRGSVLEVSLGSKSSTCEVKTME